MIEGPRIGPDVPYKQGRDGHLEIALAWGPTGND
jgi:hypothetical protein